MVVFGRGRTAQSPSRLRGPVAGAVPIGEHASGRLPSVTLPLDRRGAGVEPSRGAEAPFLHAIT